MGRKTYNKGDIVIREGDLGRSFFLIKSGSVEVVVNYGEDSARQLTVLGAGEFFGEMAILDSYTRSATVIVLEDGTVISEIQTAQFDKELQKHPEKVTELFRHLSARLRTLSDRYLEAERVLEELTRADDRKAAHTKLLDKISGLVSRALRSDSKPQQISTEAQALLDHNFQNGYTKELKKYDKGTVIFREGEPCRCLYAIHWGRVGIFAGYGTPEEKQLIVLSANHFFGEMGIFTDELRSATAVVLEDETTLEPIDKDDLPELYTQDPEKILMILRNLSFRIRRLTEEYASLCEKLYRAENY